ncbi:fimbrial protein [Pseudomonas gingeri]|uniref:Fimbrial protein n=2 Tax=Pseudomonas gingeri TaxID=117681 RepID=A0A7Y8C169_9PSED|nr:fimbrial protein [Pseudomonas gingeri]
MFSVLFLVLLSEAAMAACTRNYTQLNISIGTVTVQDNVAIGAPLTPGWSDLLPRVSWLCTENSLYAPYVQGAAGEVSRYVEAGQTHSVYPTGVNGIGIVLSAEPARRRGVQQGVEKALTSAIATAAHHAYTLNYKLIKTGTLSSGGNFNNRHVGDTWMISRGNEQFPIYISGTINSRTPTCDLATSDVNRTITLDPVRISNFTGISTGLKYFDLTANCSNASNVIFRFTGTPEPTNSALFANTTGTARGVALWLHTPGQTVSHNSTRTVAVSGNRAVLRLGAEYHKTTGALTKGSLVSTVTVNITYN